MRLKPRLPNAGFTLIELIIVIVLLSILGVMTSSYITIGSRLYSHHASLDALLGDVRFVAERVRRDMSSALGNAVVVEHDCISYVPILASAFYGKDFPIYPNKAQRITISNIPEAIAGSLAVVNVGSPNDLLSGSGQVQPVEAYLNEQNQLMFEQPVSFLSASPSQRIYFVKGKVEYCFRDQRLYKKVNNAAPVLMAENITGHFSYQANKYINVTYLMQVDGQEVALEQTVYIENQP